MLLIIGLLLFVIVGSLILLLPALWGREIYVQYAGSRAVTCPENHRQVAVSIDALHAARTGMNGPSDLHLSDCSRWPERRKCDQACLPQALRTEPYTAGEVKPATKRIFHLPILLAAFSAWYLGAVWHSQFLFRDRWREALGLTTAELKQVVLWYSPHLLSVAVCLLFAYGVAWLLAADGRKGVRRGILTSLMLWAALVLASLPAISRLSRDLFIIEAGYTGLAALLVGAIIGGLSGKLVLPVSTTQALSSQV